MDRVWRLLNDVVGSEARRRNPARRSAVEKGGMAIYVYTQARVSRVVTRQGGFVRFSRAPDNGFVPPVKIEGETN